MLAIRVIIEMTLILGCVELNPGLTHEEMKCCPRCGLAEFSGQVSDLDDHCHVIKIMRRLDNLEKRFYESIIGLCSKIDGLQEIMMKSTLDLFTNNSPDTATVPSKTSTSSTLTMKFFCFLTNDITILGDENGQHAVEILRSFILTSKIAFSYVVDKGYVGLCRAIDSIKQKGTVIIQLNKYDINYFNCCPDIWSSKWTPLIQQLKMKNMSITFSGLIPIRGMPNFWYATASQMDKCCKISVLLTK